MSENQLNINQSTFKYNMSFYYQSTLFYFAAFIIYMIIRGEFVEGSFRLITKDPVIYLFGIIVLVSLLSLLYNLYKNKYVKIENDKIMFINRFKTKFFTLDQVKRISITKKRERISNHPFRMIFIKLKNRRRPVMIRPYDYENYDELVRIFSELKIKVESR